MRIIESGVKLKKFFCDVWEDDSLQNKFIDALNKKYSKQWVYFSFRNSEGDLEAFELGLEMASISSTWLKIVQDEDSGYGVYLPDTKENFAKWLIEKYY